MEPLPTTLTTFHTTLTLRTPTPSLLTLHPPSQSKTTSRHDYTTPPIPTSVGEKFYPGPQSLVVGSVLEAVIVGGNGRVLSTATVTFGEDGKGMVGSSMKTGTVGMGTGTSAISGATTATATTAAGAVGNGWAGWSDAERSGVAAAATLAGIGLLATVVAVGWANWRRGVKRRAMERGLVLGVTRRNKSRRKGRARGIEGIENVEMGPAALKVVYGDLIDRGERAVGRRADASKALPTPDSAPDR